MRIKIIMGLLVLAIGFYLTIDKLLPEEKSIFKQAYAKQMPAYEADVFDYEGVTDVREKKLQFFDTLRPIVRNENQKIQDKRQRILRAMESGTDQQWLQQQAEHYKIEWDEAAPQWDTLLRRVDTVPMELVLTQAANESAWGTSRFAQKANNLFGQWCFSKGCGIVPEQRSKGMKHEVRAFDNINESVASYLHNINTTLAYKKLRSLREEQRDKGRVVSAMILATGLEKYSSRGKAYVKELQSMMKTNHQLMHGLN